MKLCLSFVFVLICSTAHGATQALRILDGQNAVCAEGGDIGSLAQRISIVEMTEDGDSTTLTLEIEFFECMKTAKGVQLQYSALSAAHITITDPQLLLVTNNNQVILAQKIDAKSADQQLNVTVATKALSNLDAFVRVLADRGGNGYESFGPFRFVNE